MADNKVNSGLLEFSEDQKVFVALDAETSEVKKAVTIDEDGVETDMLGVHPSGKKEITSTAEVNVANYATAQVVDEDLVAGNIKKDVDILGVVGTYEPEAPASDLDDITVTINNQTDSDVYIVVANIEESPDETMGDAYADSGQTKTLRLITYKNKAYASFDSAIPATQVTASGGVTLITDALNPSKYKGFEATADGYITIAPAQE